MENLYLDVYIKILNDNDVIKSPYKHVIRTCNIELLNYLYENNYPFNNTLFNSAIVKQNWDIIYWLKDHNCPWSKSEYFNTIFVENLDIILVTKSGLKDNNYPCRHNLYIPLLPKHSSIQDITLEREKIFI